MPEITDTLPSPDEQMARTEIYGDTAAPRPDVVLISPHDGDAEIFLQRYPQVAEPFLTDMRTFHEYLELERDIGATTLAQSTARALADLSGNGLRIDLVNIANIPRGAIDPNRTPDEDPGRALIDLKAISVTSNLSAIRNVFDQTKNPDLVRELNRLHLVVVAYIRAALDRLMEGGLFMEIHTMRDHDAAAGLSLVPEGPSIEALKAYIEQFTNPAYFGRERQANLITSFPQQPPIVHMGLVGNLEEHFANAGIKSERDHPYCFAPYVMSARYTGERPGRSASVDFPIRLISKDGKAHNIWPQLDPEKIRQLGAINARAILATLKGSPKRVKVPDVADYREAA